MPVEKIKRNAYVLVYYNSTKKWIVKMTKGEQLHTHIGVIKHDDALGQEYGSRAMTNKDKYVYLLKPTAYDFIMRMQHGTQIVYPKELGYMVARAGIRNGHKIVEIGTGSGSLTAFMAGIVKPSGHVYTYDVDTGFMAIAEKNIRKAGMLRHVTMNNLDLKKVKRVPISEMDVAVIDLGDPWEVIPQVRKMLKPSGIVISVCPTMNQLEKLAATLTANEFTDIECSEQIVRTIEAREGKTRHSFQGVGHTTYLCFARKAFFGTRRGTASRKNRPE